MSRLAKYAAGDTLGHFKLISRVAKDSTRTLWNAVCACGKKATINASKVAKSPDTLCAKCRQKSRKLKPHKCLGCGETKPKKFAPRAKGLCESCTAARARNGNCACGRPLRHVRSSRFIMQLCVCRMECPESPDGGHDYQPDIEYDSSGMTKNCFYCGKEKP